MFLMDIFNPFLLTVGLGLFIMYTQPQDMFYGYLIGMLINRFSPGIGNFFKNQLKTTKTSGSNSLENQEPTE